MRPPGKQRLAQRHEVETTPIQWKVARKGRRRLTLQEAAIVELSVTGGAIVAPARYEVPVGASVEIFWEHHAAWIVVRRTAPYGGGDTLLLYGFEYLDARNELGPDIYEKLVVEVAERRAANEAAAYAAARVLPAPVVWGAPMSFPEG